MNKNQGMSMIKKSLVIAALSISAVSAFGFINWTQKQSKGSIMAQGSEIVTTPSGLKYLIVKAGSGDAAKPGRVVSVHYTGWLFDAKAPEFKGAKFDSSVDRGQPFKFQLGAGMVIAGWDEGVAGMKVGEKRRLIIPANLGYGSRGAAGIIPGNATLVFDVEYLG
jgi:FKBP-type peptidyl-prolyl cis-trans isomerase FkpA